MEHQSQGQRGLRIEKRTLPGSGDPLAVALQLQLLRHNLRYLGPISANLTRKRFGGTGSGLICQSASDHSQSFASCRVNVSF